MTRISNSYEVYHDHLKRGRVDSSAWEKAGREKKLTLLIGAGATSCLVGNWNELLNELAVMRSVAGQDKLTQQEMRDYLDRNCSGKFFGDDIFVLEKGEYLRYSTTDQQMLSSKEKKEQWREKVFAGRVFCAVERLIRRHLLDGAGMHQKENYKADFMDWCRNKKETPFELERKILCQNKKVEEQLEKLDAKTIAQKLDLHYGTACDAGEIKKKFSAGADVTEDVCKMFSAIYEGRSDKPLREKVKSIASHKDLLVKTPAEKAQILLVKIAAFLMWRPDYATLEALLQLCAKGRVRRVITYNFDTIFDRLLADRDVTEQLVHSSAPPRVSVFGITSPRPYRWKGFDSDVSPDAVRICHVHGIVDKELDEPEPVIFSETAYRSYQEITLNPGSMQIADAYDQGSLLCVGFSGTDPNFRSVIRQLTRQAQAPVFDNMKHSIYLTHSLNEVERYYCIQEDMKPSDQPAAFQCAETFLEMMEHYFRREVGTTILWSKDYEDMARKLKTGF